jgi:hypothetical protein
VHTASVRWSDWLEEGLDTPEVRAERSAALSPEGFQNFIKGRAEDDAQVRHKQSESLRRHVGRAVLSA